MAAVSARMRDPVSELRAPGLVRTPGRFPGRIRNDALDFAAHGSCILLRSRVAGREIPAGENEYAIHYGKTPSLQPTRLDFPRLNRRIGLDCVGPGLPGNRKEGR